MTLRRNEQPQPSGASMASFSSGSASAFNSPLPSHNGFSTRTRLRPGGPSNSPSSSNNFQDNPQLLFLHTTTRNTNKIGGNFQNNGSLPSFEEIGMKTLAHPTSSTSEIKFQIFIRQKHIFLHFQKYQIKTIFCYFQKWQKIIFVPQKRI